MKSESKVQIVTPERPLPPTALLVLAACAFGLSLAGAFVLDDYAIFATQPVLTRPLAWLTLLANKALGGGNPAGYHAVNLALHLAAVWLCHDALSRLIPARAANLATVLFALHPLQSEAVNYIWARSTLLMAVFCLLALRDWARGSRWLAVAWFALALLSKEECVALPVVFALLHLSISRNRTEWKPIGAMFALAICSGAYVLYTANTTAGSQAGAQAAWKPLEYFSAQGLVILRYLQMLLIPAGQTFDPQLPTGWWYAWLPLILLAFVAASRRFLKAGPGFWFLAGLVLLLPSSSIFPANDLSADRRMYLPLAAFAAALALLVAPKLGRTAVIVLALLLASLSAYRTWLWQDPARLWTEAVEHAPGKLRPRIQLARNLPPADALAELRMAKDIAPLDPLVASETGRTLLALNRYPDALREFGQALALTPGDPRAISNRGVALLLLKQTDAARMDFERALAIDPCVAEARINLEKMGVAVTRTCTP